MIRDLRRTTSALRTASALLAVASLTAPVTALAAATPPTRPGPTVLATGSTADDEVVVVVGGRGSAGTPGVPQRPPTATVTTDRGTQAAEVDPVWSDDAVFGLVVDVSDAARPAFQAGLSGAAGLLLQLPAMSRSGVVADRRPPALAAAGSEVGVTDDLQALSELTPGGERDTSAALTLALDRLPARDGDRTVLVLYTSARDAGGEPAAALGERLRAAGAVLAVVTTAPDAGYWTSVAQATGGLAVVAPADRPIGAFDQVAGVLRSRYVATFARPTTGGAELRWTVDGATSTLPVTIPAARATSRGRSPADSAVDSESRATEGGGSPALPLTAGLVVVLLAAGAAVLVRRRRNRAPTVPQGVRVFDMSAGPPREITRSLFEPRSARDARDAEAQDAAEDEQQQAEEREAREWAARRLADLQQRRRDEAAAAAEREDPGA